MALSKNDIQNIRNTYNKLSKLEPEVIKAKACGIDCDDVERRRLAAMKTLQQYNDVHGNEYPESM